MLSFSFCISKFFADSIHFCYSQFADMHPADFHSFIHQLRSFSASLAILGRTSLEHFVLAGRCKSANVFSDFFLKSLAYFSESLYGLAPLIQTSSCQGDL